MKYINYEACVNTIRELPLNVQRTFFLTACLNENLDLCHACISAKVDMKIEDKAGKPFFIDYLQDERANVDIINLLVENGLDINYHGNYKFTPLQVACLKSKFDIIKYLVDKKAKVNSEEGNSENSEINCIFRNKYINVEQQLYIIRILLENKTKFIPDEETINNPIFNVINNSCGIEFVKLFLEYGVSINHKICGVSLLNLAVVLNDYDVVKLLLEYGADPNCKVENISFIVEYKYAVTPLDYAIKNNNEKIKNILEEYGGNISTKSTKIKQSIKCKFAEVRRETIRELKED